MRAMTVNDTGYPILKILPNPIPHEGELLIEALVLGLCGTDREIIEQKIVKPGMILGYESLGRVIKAPVDSGFNEGDLVIGYIRRACPEYCRQCQLGHYAKCESNKPLERGISGLNGFGAAGTEAAFSSCLAAMGKNSKFLVLGICHALCQPPIVPAYYIFANSEIIFTVNATKDDSAMAVALLSQMNKVDLQGFITQETTPENWWSDFVSHNGVKSIVRFNHL